MTTVISQTFSPIDVNSLIIGDFPPKTVLGTLASGPAVLPRGAVLGIVTATGDYVLAVAAATDGSQVPVAILANDADVTQGAIVANVYVTGEFADRLLTYGAGHTSATVSAAFIAANRSLFIRTLPILG